MEITENQDRTKTLPVQRIESFLLQIDPPEINLYTGSMGLRLREK